MLQRDAIKNYLEKAVPKGLSLKKQINICDELTCHIQDKADFYSFVRQLDAMKATLANGDDTIVLDKDSPIAELFYD